jgi:hypothetical protein
MDSQLQEMRDHHEIRKVLTLYCHACDRGDAELMASVYTGEDSFDDHGLVQAPGPEYATKMTANIRERTDAVWHVLGQSMITVDGDTAGAETFFLGYMRLKPNDGVAKLNQLAGRFIDRLVRIDGQWKIKHRTCVRDTSITLRVEEDMQAGYGMKPGTRDGADLGAALIGVAHRS